MPNVSAQSDTVPTAAKPVVNTGPTVLAVVGPTAAGKSQLGMALARELGGEIINADSMQLYRGMDIGTAKLPPDQRGGIRHHLFDIWDVRRTASVMDYQTRARAVVDDLRAAGRTPILVGGSGLYIRAVLDDLRFPGTDPAVRARLEDELADLGPADGPAVLHARLASVAPPAAAAIPSTNPRRVIRALEVIELTGSFTGTLPELNPVYPSVRIGLQLPRPLLAARIAARVAQMWESGLVDEVRGLLDVGLREGVTASRALGYAQVIKFLDGQLSEHQAQEETISVTRRFARRQDSWFRREPIHWLAADSPSLLQDAQAQLAAAVRG